MEAKPALFPSFKATKKPQSPARALGAALVSLMGPLPAAPLLQKRVEVFHLLFPEHHSWLSWQGLSRRGRSPVPLLTRGHSVSC